METDQLFPCPFPCSTLKNQFSSSTGCSDSTICQPCSLAKLAVVDSFVTFLDPLVLIGMDIYESMNPSSLLFSAEQH